MRSTTSASSATSRVSAVCRSSRSSRSRSTDCSPISWCGVHAAAHAVGRGGRSRPWSSSRQSSLPLRPDITPTGTLRVAILQGNDKNRDLTQAEKDAALPPDRATSSSSAQVRDPVDLIIFPESSMDEDPRTDAVLARQLAAVAREHDAWVLTNAVVDAPDGRAVNLNLLYGPDGELQDTYAKRHLVPFGEYVKFRDQLGWTGAPDEIPRDFVPGDRTRVCSRSPATRSRRSSASSPRSGTRSARSSPTTARKQSWCRPTTVRTGARRTRPSTSRSARCAPPRPAGPSCTARSPASARSSTPTGACSRRPNCSSAPSSRAR